MLNNRVVIIGAGAAGLSAAIYASRSSLEVVLLEKKYAGGQVATSSEIANYPGFPSGVDGFELAERMREQAEKFGAKVIVADVNNIFKNSDNTYLVNTTAGDYQACAVIIASGSDPIKLNVPGEARLLGRGVSYCATCDGPFFKNKKIVVVGGGDAAMKESLHLVHFASEITMAVRANYFRRGEEIYKQQVLSNPKINVLFNTQIEEILGDDKVSGVKFINSLKNETTIQQTDGVFIFIGSHPNTEFVGGLFPDCVGKQLETDHDMLTNLPGIFVAGDVRKNSYRQIVTAAGEGAVAAMAAQKYLASLSIK